MQGLKKVLLLTKKMIMQEPFKEFKPLAERGDQEIQGYLAAMYLTGKGVPKDDTQALHFYKKAADQGLPDALNSIAMMYRNGIGVPQDYSQAL